MVRHRLTDEEWELIQDAFPPPAKTGRPPSDRREVMDAILWVLNTGGAWRDLDSEFKPHWSTVWEWFDRWNNDGTLDEIRKRLQAVRAQDGEIDEELWCVDGTVVRAARCAAGGGKKKTPRNRPTTRWAAPAGDFRRKSTSSATARATRSTST